jgi:hypothetical protein
LWKENQTLKERAADRTSKRFMWMTLFLFVIIVVTTVILTLTSKISGEATSFLLGVVVTGAISVIRDFTGGR